MLKRTIISSFCVGNVVRAGWPFPFHALYFFTLRLSKASTIVKTFILITLINSCLMF